MISGFKRGTVRLPFRGRIVGRFLQRQARSFHAFQFLCVRCQVELVHEPHAAPEAQASRQEGRYRNGAPVCYQCLQKISHNRISL